MSIELKQVKAGIFGRLVSSLVVEFEKLEGDKNSTANLRLKVIRGALKTGTDAYIPQEVRSIDYQIPDKGRNFGQADQLLPQAASDAHREEQLAIQALNKAAFGQGREQFSEFNANRSSRPNDPHDQVLTGFFTAYMVRPAHHLAQKVAA